MKLSIVIPNYNGEELLKKNLPEILESCPGSEIIVVDDASTDGSVVLLEKHFPTVRVIAKKRNDGFSSTVNAGVAATKHELVMLLNSDAYPLPGFFDKASAHFDNPQVFAVGLAQECNEEAGKIIRGRGLGMFRQGFLIHRYAPPDDRETFWVSGGAGVFRKKMWEELGGMCRLYNPFYWEDIDLSYRAMKAGYRILFESKARVVHRQSVGSIRKNFTEERIKTIAYRNQCFFVWLNITDAAYLLQHFIRLPVHVLQAAVSGDGAFLKGLLGAALQLPSVLKERENNKMLWKKSDKDIVISG